VTSGTKPVQPHAGRHRKEDFDPDGRAFPSLENPVRPVVDPDYIVRFLGKEWGMEEPRDVAMTNQYLAELLRRRIAASNPSDSLRASGSEQVEVILPSSGVFVRFTIQELLDGDRDFFNFE